mmetsp:Transcript_23003/g.57648  ORF Transcript_23003/g.57648 Transcript_23003/m.57648 type:complete len:330 (+) Transcript_23003:136-1125(+)
MSIASFNPTWHQTMLRIKDPKATLPFYKDLFGFDHIDTLDFPQWKFSIYFLTHLPDGVSVPGEPGTPESHEFLWKYKGATLELTHNYGTETDPDFKGYDSGNNEPKRGFGHIAVMCADVYKSCEKLEASGVQFKKRPDEGRMKGLAFAYDPDGYWIEIIKRDEEFNKTTREFNYAQTMLRIKDPAKSIAFYENFGMKLVDERHFPADKGDFSLFFLCTPMEDDVSLPDPKNEDAGRKFMKTRFHPVLELTHNHGTEKQEGRVYHDGNSDPRGFGHIGFLVDDLEAACAVLIEAGVEFKKKPQDGNMRGIAFAYDPDGYWVEIIQRDAKF